MHKPIIPYRPEIDGLRAVAVIAVILFHLNNNWLPGGFLGVDVFFVISGFLITSLLYPQISQGTFSSSSLFTFWKRRFYRLYPALMLMTAVVLLAGAFLLIIPERNQLPIQALSTLFSAGNILFWRTTSGYWALTSENISLLHTWSLALEVQFYICFPLFLLLIARFTKKRKEKQILLVVIAATFISFALCLYTSIYHPIASFYLLPTRIWELFLGSLLAINRRPPPHKLATPLQISGIIILIASFLLIDHNKHLASFSLLFPCMGTLLILWPESSNAVVHRFLVLPPIVYLGKLSYSLYLWHWPTIVFLKYTNPLFNLWIALSLTFVLSVVSYHFFECPFRYGFSSSKRKRDQVALPLVSVGLALCFLPLLLLPTSPLIRDLGNIQSEASLRRGREFEATQLIRDEHPGLFINAKQSELDLCIIGSSHARVLCPPFAEYAKTNRLSMLSMAMSGIEISQTSPKKGIPDAGKINQSRLDHLYHIKPKVTIVVGAWYREMRIDPNFIEELIHTLEQIADKSEHVIVMGQVPFVDLPKAYPRNALRKYLIAQQLAGHPLSLKPSNLIPQTNQVVKQAITKIGKPNIIFIDPSTVFIGQNGEIKIVQNGQFLYSSLYYVNDTGAFLIFDSLLRHKLDNLFELKK